MTTTKKHIINPVFSHHHIESMGGRKGKVQRALKKWQSHSDDSALKSLLSRLNLVLKETEGDGNCLFRALSDQLYGSPSQHLQIRTDICNYISQHKEDFEPFVSSDEERGFERHLELMKQCGTYGGNLELVAFSRRFGVKVFVYQADGLVYAINPSESNETDTDSSGGDEEGRPRTLETKKAHIAYHAFEHYSSIRNAAGPFEGPPRITVDPTKTTLNPSTDNGRPKKEKLSKRQQKQLKKGKLKLKQIKKRHTMQDDEVDAVATNMSVLEI